MNNVYRFVKGFKNKYPMTIAWRLKAHSKIIEKYLNPGEKIIYAFACQKNHFSYEIFMTYVVVLTNQRIMIAQKRMLFGHFYITVTPDMYNDLTIRTGILWGKLNIDTIKETIQLSNIDKKALPEIETAISSYMLEAKKAYNRIND